MTIQSTFQLGSERIIVRIIRENVLFFDLQNNMMSPLEGLRFSREGAIKEYPDLKDDENWKQKAIQRFTDKIKSLPSETKRMEWIIEEIRKMGYTPLYQQQDGWRLKRIK